jgi:hypothetical protein
MPTNKLTPKKAASRQSDLLIMSILGLVVIGAAVIIWQSYQLNVLESTYATEVSSAGTSRCARLASVKSQLANENEALKTRLERWNEQIKFEMPQANLLETALKQAGRQTDILLGESGILSVGAIVDDAKTPYSIILIKEGQSRNVGLFAVKRVGVGEGNYELVPNTTVLVGAQQTIGAVAWTQPKLASYQIVTTLETGAKEVENKLMQLP